MTNDETKDLSDSEKLNLILSELADIRTWRTKIDAFIEDRTRDTRPLFDALHAHVDRIGEDMKAVRADVEEIKVVVKRLDRGFTQISRELMDVKAATTDIDSRLGDIERKPS